MIRWTQKRDKYKRLSPKWRSSDGKAAIVLTPHGKYVMQAGTGPVHGFDSLDEAKKAYKEQVDA